MAADVPFVSYKNRKEKKATKASSDRLADEWAEKHKSAGKTEKIKLSEFFNKKDINTLIKK